ncbi:hypothetical protein ACFE04_028249 [Oxalis oulophora]
MASSSHSKNTHMEFLKLFDDEHNSDTGSLLCYCDVPALILSSNEVNKNKRTLVACSKYNEARDVVICKLKIHYLEYLNKKLVGANQDLKLYVPSTTPVQMRDQRGKPAFKKMLATRSTWKDNRWFAEEHVILEGSQKLPS